MITVQQEIKTRFALSDAHMYQLRLQYAFDFICMWSIKFDKSIHPLVPAALFQFGITAPRYYAYELNYILLMSNIEVANCL